MKTPLIQQIGFIVSILAAFLLAGCSTPEAKAERVELPVGSSEAATVEFTLLAGVGDGRIVYTGVGGEIDGLINPDLKVRLGDVVRIVVINGDGMQHDLSIPDFNVKTPFVAVKGEQVEVTFEVKGQPDGAYAYFCTSPGHRQAGQEGRLVVEKP